HPGLLDSTARRVHRLTTLLPARPSLREFFVILKEDIPAQIAVSAVVACEPEHDLVDTHPAGITQEHYQHSRKPELSESGGRFAEPICSKGNQEKKHRNEFEDQAAVERVTTDRGRNHRQEDRHDECKPSTPRSASERIGADQQCE